ncbi:MAG: hypothetical protein C0412_20420 [Flavobacterium sp.]|jgi:hypothetical protein|nr:hypothetical protein [Flavobacterium sp.]
MNNFSTKNGNKKNTIIFMMFVCVLLSNVAAFGQTAVENNVQTATIENNEIVNTSVEMSSMKQEATSNASNMNFVLWFMGSKQDPNAKALPAGVNTKKQFMTSGTAPNRLLIKAFLKKAVNFESAVV